MIKAYLGRVNHQSKSVAGKGVKQMLGQWPITHLRYKKWIAQKAMQPVGQTWYLPFHWPLTNDLRQVNGSTQVQTNHKQGQVAFSGNPFVGKPLAKLMQELMIKLKVVSHWQLLDKVFM
jgi:hypothetical protein